MTEGDERGESPQPREELPTPAARFSPDRYEPDRVEPDRYEPERVEPDRGPDQPGAAQESWQPQYGPGGPPFGGYQQQAPPWSRQGPPPAPSRPQPGGDQHADHWRAQSQEMSADPTPSASPQSPQSPQQQPRARRARGGYRPPPEPGQAAAPAAPTNPPTPPGAELRHPDPAPVQYAEPQYAEPQRVEPPYPDPQYASGPYAENRYTESGYAQVPAGVEPGYPQSGPVPVPVDPVTAPYQGGPEAPKVGPYDQQYDLSSAQLHRSAKRPPRSGWRKAVYVASGRLINLGESPADVAHRELVVRVNQPLHGCYKIAMLSLKGGVGKTTTTTTLGATFASLRGDRVVALDANPDRGTLAYKQPVETSATVRHLLLDADRIRRYSDVRAYTSQGESRLEIIASEQDPAVTEAFNENDYRQGIEVLEHFYNIVLTDCGTGLMHSAMRGVLGTADCLVVVSSASIDAARSASATLDWLDAHGYRELVARSIAVINSVRPKSSSVDVDRLVAHFDSRCRTVCRIPFDPHLEEGVEIELERLAPATRRALLELAATVADDFPHAVAFNQPR